MSEGESSSEAGGSRAWSNTSWSNQHPTQPPSGDLGVVTYRHLLSAGSLNPSNPLRVVAHVDVDSAYAQFEAKRLGIDSFKVPVAVQQWSGLIAISYKAREFGISRHETIETARKMCPELLAVHVQTIAPGASHPAYNEDPRPETHKVSLDPYRRESRKIMAVFKATCPMSEVEKASIDESYFDLTLEVRKLILTKYPHLQECPKTGRGMDEPLPAPPIIDWDNCGALIPVKSIKTDKENDEEETGDPPSQEHQYLNPTWTDVALAHGAFLLTKIRAAVMSELGYSTSSGIASNKTLAKLCSGYRKPNGQTTLLPRSVPGFLRDLPVSKIRFLGGKLGREMGEMWDAQTVGDLWSIPLETMQTHFGSDSTWVHAVLRGVDHAPVTARIANKTMMASKNLRPTIRRPHEALSWIAMLSNELVIRLREIWADERGVDDVDNEEVAKKLIPTLWPKVLVLRFIRTRGGHRSRQCPFPYVTNLQGKDVQKMGEKLWAEACDEMKLGQKGSGPEAGTEVVTIALGFSGLERGEAGQKTIEGFFGGKRKLDDVVDQGEDTRGEQHQQHQWRCDECPEVISVPGDPSEDLTAARLAIQVQDHKDWHLAVKLSAEDRETSSPAAIPSPAISRNNASNKKMKKGKGRLDSFFQKKPTT
jgi:DNA polymerase eta